MEKLELKVEVAKLAELRCKGWCHYAEMRCKGWCHYLESKSTGYSTDLPKAEDFA